MNKIFLEQADYREARRRIDNYIHRTPVYGSSLLSREIGAELYLKCENLQKTGSFKVRGALNKILQLDRDALSRGVVTVSAGNHAQSTAWAAQAANAPCTVVILEKATQAKIDASRGYGAEVVIYGTGHDSFEKAREFERERKMTFVHPFDDLQMIAGHGSIGLELEEQLGEVDVVVVPVGGGGLMSGIAGSIKSLQNSTRIYGVEPEGANVMQLSFKAGEPVKMDSPRSIADGLCAPMAGEYTFRYAQYYLEDVVSVTDDEIRHAMGLLLSRCKTLAEPAGAASLAALLSNKIPFSKGDRIVAVVSGGNIDLEKLKELL